MSNFNIGDVVKFTSSQHKDGGYFKNDIKATIQNREMGIDGSIFYRVSIDNFCGAKDVWEENLELIINKNTMSNIVEFFKNISASKEDKLLKEMGIEDPINVPTEEGLKLSGMIDYKKNRDDIIKICQQKKAEEEVKKE
jgi:hypothetical protein